MSVGLVLALAFMGCLLQPAWRWPSIQNEEGAKLRAQVAAGVQAAEPKFRLVRSISGSRGEEKGGQFIVEDPRTVFYISGDRQVVVYFEWEGMPGTHHLEGLWKNPEGKIVVLSDFDYEAKQRRFAAYWTLMLSENVPTGIWALEARVDGELAGTHTFQIAAGTRPTPVVPARRMRTPAEIYQRALAATVSVESLAAGGERLTLGSGFFVSEEAVLTGFEVIDGASSVRLLFSDGRSVPVEGVVASNRREDWAILRSSSSGTHPLERAQAGSWGVGDRCFALDVPQEGNRTIVEGNIVGKRSFPDSGERLNLSFSLLPQASGSPLFNEYGEVIGLVVRHSLLPGSVSLKGVGPGFPMNLFRPGAPLQVQAALAVPISVVPPSAQASVTPLNELARRGQFTPPLAAYREIILGSVARQVDRKRTFAEPVDESFEFSRRDPQVVVYVLFDPKEKLRTTAIWQLYDLDNRWLGASKPATVKLDPGRVLFCSWNIVITSLPPGTYRVDVALGPDPVWRTFFRVVE